jgi:hypothetical protein
VLTRPKPSVLIAGVLIVYVIYSLAIAVNRAPWYDEGFLVNPAYSWITTGYPGVSILDDTGSFIPIATPVSMKGIREHMYMEMPLYIVGLGAWLKIFGLGLLTSRAFTILCGAIVLMIWYFVVRRLTNDATVALVTLTLVATDYGFILRASEARMDMMSAALGFGGLAVYLLLRLRSFTRAVFLSHLCAAVSALAHPNGGILAWGGLIFLTLYYDGRRIRFRHVLIALAPYLIAGACWGVYIYRDVDSFKRQFGVNLTHGGRLQTFNAPLSTIKREIEIRYLGSMGGIANTGIAKIKLLIVITYFLGVVGILAIKKLRQNQGYRALLILTGVHFLLLAFSDGRKSQCYVVYLIPLHLSLVASVIVWVWRTQGQSARVAIVALVLVLAAVNAGGVAYHFRKDTYHKVYLPAISFLKQNVGDQQVIIGPGTLGFGLAYSPRLIDDFRLGKLSGKTPDWIVIDDWYSESWFPALKNIEPDTYRFIADRLANQYEPKYNDGMTIYRKK